MVAFVFHQMPFTIECFHDFFFFFWISGDCLLDRMTRLFCLQQGRLTAFGCTTLVLAPASISESKIIICSLWRQKGPTQFSRTIRTWISMWVNHTHSWSRWIKMLAVITIWWRVHDLSMEPTGQEPPVLLYYTTPIPRALLQVHCQFPLLTSMTNISR